MSVFPKLHRNIFILAPLIFICHFVEESPGFVNWFNSHVSQGITQGLFWSVNITGLVITILVTIAERLGASSVSAAITVLWFSFLMFANAIFHIVAALIDGDYVPGLITAIVLYLPYYFLTVRGFLQKGRLKLISILILTIVGSSLMLIHGWLIIFRGSRLF